MHKFRTILSVVATAAMVLGTMGAATASAASANETRTDFIVQLDQSLGIQAVTPSTPDFSDVPSTNAAYGYIEAAYQKGFINGIAKGLFGPTLPITRAEAAKILVEAYEGGNYTPTQTSTTFTDNASIPSALVGFVAEANSLKLMLGFTSGSFGPEAYLTTAQETHLIAQLKTVQVAAGFKVTASATDVGPGQTVTLTSSVPNATFAVTTAPSGAAYGLAGNMFSATTAGNYVITGTVDGITATAAVTVYGAPTTVVLTGSKTIVADGDNGVGDGAENTITATVEDANGNTVANFNGNVTLYDSSNATMIIGSGNTFTSSYTVTAQNGVATFTVESDGVTAGLTDTLTATATNVGGTAVGQGTLAVTSVAPTASALSLSAKPSSIDVNALNATTTLSVSVADAAGNTFSGVPEQVTLSLSGPGSFTSLSAGSPTPTTTETLYVNGSQSVTVYGVEGQTGTINVTASATGLTAGTLKIPTVISGVPAKLGVTSSNGTTATGVPYTVYTVQLQDATGNAITSGTGAIDAITLSDNEGALGGGLTYWSVVNGAPSTQVGSSSAAINEALSNGSYSFAVETNGTSSTAPTITIKDTTESFSTTVSYGYQLGSASKVAFETGGNTYSSLGVNQLYAEQGTAVTLSAQVVDAANNIVAKAGQTVDFELVATTGASLPTGSNAGVIYAVPTNAQGVASVTVNTNSANSFQLEAFLAGSSSITDSPNVQVNGAAGAVTGMQVGYGSLSQSTFGPLNSGSGATIFGQLQNPIGTPVNETDTLLISTSNGNILTASGLTGFNGSSTTWKLGVGENFQFGVSGGLDGTSSLTITDVSNLNVAPVTETLNVVTPSGATASKAAFYYNGLPVSAANPLSVTANTPVLLYVESTDAGGNPMDVATTTTYSLSDVGSPPGSFLIDNSGTPGAVSSTVTIDAGQYQAPVYYINANTETIANNTTLLLNGGTAVTSTGASQVVFKLNGPTLAPGNYTVGGTTPVDVTVENSSGVPVNGATVLLTASPGFEIAGTPGTSGGSGTLSAVSGANGVNGQVVAYITSTNIAAQATGAITAYVEGTSPVVTLTSGTITLVPGAASQLGVSTIQPNDTFGESADPVAPITVKVEDVYGNPVGSGTQSVSLTSSAATGGFGTSTGSAFAPGSATITLTAGTNTAEYYGDTKTGTDTITASTSGLTSGTLTLTVTAGIPATATSPVYSASSIVPPASGSAAVSDPVVTQPTVKDGSGNVLADTGTYSIAPAATGIGIDGVTGAVSVAAGAAVGTYTVTYTQSAAISTATITVTAGPLSTVTVGAFTSAGSSGAFTFTSTVTLADANGNPITGATAADFAASDAGAANLTVGTVTAVAGTPGAYTVVLDSTNTTTLTDTATITVTINSVVKTGSNTL